MLVEIGGDSQTRGDCFGGFVEVFSYTTIKLPTPVVLTEEDYFCLDSLKNVGKLLLD